MEGKRMERCEKDVKKDVKAEQGRRTKKGRQKFC
jgi:hypothetical protein